MTTHHLTLQQQTRLAVHIVIEDDTGMLTYSLLVATRLFALLWQLSRFVSSVRRELSSLRSDVQAALGFTVKVMVISFKALAFGVGVTL